MTAATPTITKTQYPSAVLAWTIWGCAALYYLYEYVLRVSPSVITNELMRDFGVTSSSIGVLIAYYYYIYVPLQLPCGMIVDRFGARRVVTISCLLCALASYLFAVSETIYLAQIARFIMGAGSACAYLSCAKLAADWFPPEKFAVLTATTMMMGTFGGTFGGQPFAMMSNAIGWRSSMLVMAAIGAGVTVACWLLIKDRQQTNTAAQSVPVTYGFWEGLQVIISKPQVWMIGIYGGLMYVPLSAFAELWGVPYLMQVHGINNEVASLASAMVFIGMALGCPIGATISNRIHSRRKVMSWSALLTLAMFLIVIYVPGIPLIPTFAILFLAGLFCGGQILYFAAAKELTPPELSGTVVGFTNSLVMVSGVIFQPLLGHVLDHCHDGVCGVDGTPIYTESMYQIALLAVPACLFAAWLIMQFVRETYAHSE